MRLASRPRQLLALIAAFLAITAGVAHAGPDPDAWHVGPPSIGAVVQGAANGSFWVASAKYATGVAAAKAAYHAVHTAHPAAHAASSFHGNATGVYKGLLCGGDLPSCTVLAREDPTGDPTVWNGGCHAPYGYAGPPPCGAGHSTASGKWQFLRGTWARFKGYLNAADAPVDVQDDKARIVWGGGAGCSNWAAC